MDIDEFSLLQSSSPHLLCIVQTTHTLAHARTHKHSLMYTLMHTCTHWCTLIYKYVHAMFYGTSYFLTPVALEL